MSKAMANGQRIHRFDVTEAWAKAERRLKRMSEDEKRQTLIEAGILTSKGNIAKPYRKVFTATKKPG